MTIIFHSVSAGCVAFVFSRDPFVIGTAMMLGAMPDIGRIFAKDWSIYNKFHKLNWNLLIPFWNLHIIIDYFCHDKETGKWKPWVAKTEVCLWLVMLLYFELFKKGLI